MYLFIYSLPINNPVYIFLFFKMYLSLYTVISLFVFYSFLYYFCFSLFFMDSEKS